MQNQSLNLSVHLEWREVRNKGGALPAIRTGAKSFYYEDNLYLFQGYGAGIGRSSEIWKMNTVDGSWEVIETLGNNSDKASARDGHSLCNIGEGLVLLFGGQGEPSPNEKSERVLDPVKTKTWSIRDLYNDLYQFDVKNATWERLTPEGGVPLCRRGHSAIYFPKGGYSEHQLDINGLHQHQHQHHHHHHSMDEGGSPGRRGKKKSNQEYPEEFEPIPENSMIVYGGSGMEVSKYIEAVYNDVWVYSLDTLRWTKVITRGADARPVFDHQAIRVGHLMFIIGGITATNARNKDGSTALPLEQNQEVMVLNMKTLMWHNLLILQPSGRSCKLNLHGHTLVTDPYEEGIWYLYGGKDAVEGRVAAVESQASAKKFLKKSANECHAWMIDIKACIMKPIIANNMPPENRYEHVMVSSGEEGRFLVRPPQPKRKAETRDEVLFYLFGGARMDMYGYCDPIVYQLVRSYVYTNPDLASVASMNSKSKTKDMSIIEDDHTISTHHTNDSFHQEVDIDLEEGDLRQPSIWEKKQSMDIQTGKSMVYREPSCWEELKLALSSSMTDKRSAHSLAAKKNNDSMTFDESRVSTAGSRSRPASSVAKRDGGESTVEGEKDGGTEMALSAKAMRKREIRRLKALGQKILPIVKGKSYLTAKDAYFDVYPAPLPKIQTYQSSLRASRSKSTSQL